MSAADPSPPDAPAPSALEVVAAELESLRRKVDDNAALVRRNQLALTELAENVGKLVAEQRRRERLLSLNSFVAYVLFTILLGGGFLLLYQSRADALVAARDRTRRDRDVEKRRADDLAADLAARDAASQQALAYWKLLESGQRDEAIARYGAVQGAALTPTERELFAAREKQARAEIIDSGYLAGLDAFRAARYKDAIPMLERALGYEQEGPRAAQMRYYLGVALVKTGVPVDGEKQLTLALAGRVDENGVVDARFWLATALEKQKRYGEARAEYDKFATAQPKHPLAWAARRKSAALARVAPPKN
jgi:tetratricopeptide (TPR) repeat protein